MTPERRDELLNDLAENYKNVGSRKDWQEIALYFESELLKEQNRRRSLALKLAELSIKELSNEPPQNIQTSS